VICPPGLVLGEILNGGGELEVSGEEVLGPGKHELVALSDRHISHACNFSNISLCSLVAAGLARHVDGGGGHADGGPPRHNVQVHRLLGDVRGRLLDVAGQAECAAESGHEVPGSDELHARVVGLQDQLETTTYLLLTDCADCDDLLECPGDALLPTGDVQARRRDRIVGPTLEVSTVVDHLEECVGALNDRLRQVDSVRHVGYGSECIDECSV